MSYPMFFWQIDWNKIQKWEDLKELLQGCDMQPRHDHPQFDEIKRFCKLVDRDGKPVAAATSESKTTKGTE